MSITTKRGDSGYTSTLSGERVPKYHIVTEAVGTLDEASSLIGLARASSREKRIKRILLQVQKQLVTVGAELSVPKGTGRPPKKTISEIDVRWLEKLVDDLEESLALPPGFVAFGQEPDAAQMNVARTAVRKAERTVVKMHGEGLVENPSILRYLNRLSDLVFLLACFEEKGDSERRNINRALLHAHLSDPSARKMAVFVGSTILALIAAIILLLIFHRPAQERPANTSPQHMQEIGNMHK
jgi:cob(I)alamin adenosyltransferase